MTEGAELHIQVVSEARVPAGLGGWDTLTTAEGLRGMRGEPLTEAFCDPLKQTPKKMRRMGPQSLRLYSPGSQLGLILDLDQ